ncbi:PadR family transcriptional regulator [Deinococcus peraridilitoris]|nr:PadR family transcriptional regulator [Deinococcus peraridilitoris]
MTLPTLQVLHVLYDDLHSEHYGLDLSRKTTLKSGTLYPILARLEQHGLVTSAWENVNPKAEGRPARRYYRLTGSGCCRAYAELERARAALNPAMPHRTVHG